MKKTRGDGSNVLPLPTLPFEVVDEILCRLPVKLLMQLMCVCKSWKSLISDTKFSKKHLNASTRCHRLITASLMDYPLSSVSTTATTASATQLQYPLNNQIRYHHLVGSCDDILCFAIDKNSALLWNPSIRKFNKLPDLENLHPVRVLYTIYGFGYDHFTNEYKVVAFSGYRFYSEGKSFLESQVKVYTLGTNCWRKIPQKFPLPYDGFPGPLDVSGIFVNGTVNWRIYKESSCQHVIVSLHLGNESYQEVLQPDYEGMDYHTLTLSVLGDCLCVLSHSHTFVDIWVMKEYGNKESWTKLFSVPTDLAIHPYANLFPHTKALYVSEDDQLLEFSSKLIVYNSRDGSFKILNIIGQNSIGRLGPKVYVESLISPFS